MEVHTRMLWVPTTMVASFDYGRHPTMTTKTARLVRTGLLLGNANLYRVDPPMIYDNGVTQFVIVSASVVPFSGPETYIFPADSAGGVIDWGELDGSFRGGLDHEAALSGAGYIVE